jgi:hypothetical protein
MNRARIHPQVTPLFPVAKPQKTAIWDRIKHHAILTTLSVAMGVSAVCAIWYLTPLHHLAGR